MRVLPLLIAALASTGCSGFVAASGTDLSKLNSRSEVRAKFGTPVATGTSNGEPFELYRTHRKIRDVSKGMGIVMIDTMTLGLAELALLPRETFIAGRQMILGQDLLVQYDAQGRVVQLSRDGEVDPFTSFRRNVTPASGSEPTEEPKP